MASADALERSSSTNMVLTPLLDGYAGCYSPGSDIAIWLFDWSARWWAKSY
ncbi:MAG TPA: hypothetical protein VFG99_04505 [Chloroflexia bacterium]|nr:hypothetical protein [Chloroflexia bacterium]